MNIFGQIKTGGLGTVQNLAVDRNVQTTPLKKVCKGINIWKAFLMISQHT